MRSTCADALAVVSDAQTRQCAHINAFKVKRVDFVALKVVARIVERLHGRLALVAVQCEMHVGVGASADFVKTHRRHQ